MLKGNITIKDIMKMTNLSERTIRRYIREGKLRGTKIGKEWHFSEEQVRELFSLKEFGVTISQQATRDVRQFLLGKYEKRRGASCCLIIDFTGKTKEEAGQIKDALLETVNREKDFKMKFVPEDNIIRITLTGTLNVISKVIKKMEAFK